MGSKFSKKLAKSIIIAIVGGLISLGFYSIKFHIPQTRPTTIINYNFNIRGIDNDVIINEKVFVDSINKTKPNNK